MAKQNDLLSEKEVSDLLDTMKPIVDERSRITEYQKLINKLNMIIENPPIVPMRACWCTLPLTNPDACKNCSSNPYNDVRIPIHSTDRTTEKVEYTYSTYSTNVNFSNDVKDGVFYIKNNETNNVLVCTIEKLTQLILEYTTYPRDIVGAGGSSYKMLITDFLKKYTIIEEVVK